MTHRHPCLIAEGKFDNPCSCVPMTHDELLKKIDWIGKTKDGESGTATALGVAVLASLNALRAVVELHRNVDGACWECQDSIYHEYPCPTIRAIDKELG